MSEVTVGRFEDLPAGGLKRVEVAGAPVVLVRVGDTVYACSDVCAHKGGPLSEGRLTGACLAYPWHGFMYDVKTGECAFPGRGARVPTYPVRVEGDEIRVSVP